jgi:hypothetical protein
MQAINESLKSCPFDICQYKSLVFPSTIVIAYRGRNILTTSNKGWKNAFQYAVNKGKHSICCK